MSSPYYAIFRMRGAIKPVDHPPPVGIKITWWKPGWFRVFPSHHKSLRVFAFWFMSRIGMLRNRDYAVLIIEDDTGKLIHRTFCLPGWLQFPFMQTDDMQLSDVYTADSVRQQGIGVFAVKYCIHRLAKAGRDIYYIAQSTNVPSHRLAQRAGLQFHCLARKKPTGTVGYYSPISYLFDYSFVRRIASHRYSRDQVKDIVESEQAQTQHPALERPLRVLAVVPYSTSPTSMIFARRQMAALARQGDSVEILELNDRRSVRSLFSSIVEYRRLLRTFRPHVVHAHYGAMTSFFSVCGAIGLAPTIVTFRGSDLNPVPSLSFWRVVPSHFFSKVAAIGASQVICVSAELRERLWWGKDKAALIPTGVDTTKFYPGSRTAERLALGWSDEPPVVLFNAGHSPPVKRLDLAEAVISIVRKSIPEVKFIVMQGEVSPDEVPKLMRASDCLLFTSDFEGSPTVIQEAMASNLPIVSVPVGDVPERIAHVSESFLVPRDVTKLAEAVLLVLKRRARSNGFEIAEAELGNSAIMANLRELYLYVMRRG